MDVINVKLIMGLLIGPDQKIERCSPALHDAFGQVDYVSGPTLFSVTDYYDQELGSPINRYFMSFKQLIDPAALVSIKHQTAQIEDTFREKGRRTVNIDPGYLDFFNVVLASFKVGGFKIYVGDGVYADMTLHYSKGRFVPFDWGFPDFKLGLYNRIFLDIRALYKRNLKETLGPESQDDQYPNGFGS
ncbi:DUF4416 family protein [bacterium]|nr:DUF4416 family protein [bacterium]